MPLGDILDHNARNWPQRTAVVDGEHRVSFGELRDRSRRLGQALAGLTDQGDRVGILAQNGLPYVEAMYGVPSAGRVLTLLNYRLHPREWAWILADAGARALLVEAQFLDAIRPFLGDVPSLEHLVVIGGSNPAGTRSYDELIEAAPSEPAPVEVAETDTAFLVYTSGTTGFPKGAMISHGAVRTGAVLNAMEGDVRWQERYLMAFPMCHAAGFVLYQYHARSAEFVLMPAFDPESFLELIESHRVTRTALAPTMASLVLAHPAYQRCDLSSLKVLNYGGMPMPVPTAAALAERFELGTGFGQTESTLLVTVLTGEDHRRALAEDEQLLLSCGRSFGLTTVTALDDDLNELPPGEIGELCVRSDYAMTGYWGNPDATRDAFAGGWLHTGDVARRDAQGYLYLVDRKKDLIISGGQNIYPTEVERVIHGLPAVADVAVIGLPDPVWGERVVAVVVRRAEAELTAETVIEACRAELAGYKKPKEVVFVEALPKTVTGKIRKRELRAELS